MTEKAENLRETLTMNVWDKEDHEKTQAEIVHIYPDNSCIEHNGICWEYCEEIPTKEWRAFKLEESLEHLKDCWFRRKNSNIQVKPERYDPTDEAVFDFTPFTWCDRAFLFKNYEVLVNNKWQPVGVFI